MLTPLDYRTLPCPTYPEIRLSLVTPRQVRARIAELAPDAVHIATEGPLGWSARAACRRLGMPFTTAYHTRFPEYVAARFRIPARWTYALLRSFHAPAARVMAPTPSVQRDLEGAGFQRVVQWSRGVDTSIFHPGPRDRLGEERPIFLYVGRVAIEKNVEAFLELDLPGVKWVVGEGPQLADLKRRFPQARYAGVQSQTDLARFYRAADVFVFPSRTDTFGLVLLEALACGLPVAAYPVTGPIDVVTDPRAGALDKDLRAACLKALDLRREDAEAFAHGYSWERAASQFIDHLHPLSSPAE
jgi:glycosyltransferase involved in cell wall biosynthesis